MAVYKLFPTKDSSLYSVSQSMNTGIDEILDFSTYVYDGVGQTNRALVKFSDSEMNNVVNNIVSTGAGILIGHVFTFDTGTLGIQATYNNVPLIGTTSGQNNALAKVIVDASGDISSCIVSSPGSGYVLNEKVVIAANLLGAGSLLSTDKFGILTANQLSYDADLKLFAAVVSGLSQDSTVEVFPISQSWNMGTGKYYNNPQTQNGCSWIWNDFSGSIIGGVEQKWQTTGFTGPGLSPYATASYNPAVTNNMEGGGTWYYADTSGTEYEMKQDYSYSNPIDLNIRVTPSFQMQMAQIEKPEKGQKNEGFIIKQTGSQEFLNDVNTQATFRFFSIDTNTIYPPQLEIKWDNYKFITGSNPNGILNDNQALISIYNNNGIYYSQSIAEFRIGAAPKFPIRQFQTASQYNTNHFLPENTSLYAIKDSETNEMIIDFDSNFTKISADSTSSYFTIYMNGLEPERDYTILIKTQINGVTNVFDEDMRFKVVNG